MRAPLIRRVLASDNQINRGRRLRRAGISVAVLGRRPRAAGSRVSCRGVRPVRACTRGQRISSTGWIVNSACNLGNDLAETRAWLGVVFASRLLGRRFVPTLGRGRGVSVDVHVILQECVPLGLWMQGLYHLDLFDRSAG